MRLRKVTWKCSIQLHAFKFMFHSLLAWWNNVGWFAGPKCSNVHLYWHCCFQKGVNLAIHLNRLNCFGHFLWIWIWFWRCCFKIKNTRILLINNWLQNISILLFKIWLQIISILFVEILFIKINFTLRRLLPSYL